MGSSTERTWNFVFCLLCMSNFLDPACASFRGFYNRQDNVIARKDNLTAGQDHVTVRKEDVTARQDNVTAMTVVEVSTRDLKTPIKEDTYQVTQADNLAMHLNSTSTHTETNQASFHKKDEQKTISRGNFKLSGNKLLERNKESPSLFQNSLGNDPIDFQDISEEPGIHQSGIHKLPDFLQVIYRDKFRCLPCQCYYTFSGSLVASCGSRVASCNSSIHEINEALSNKTQQLTISNSSLEVFQATDFLQYNNLYNLTITYNTALHTVANSSEKIHMLPIKSLNLSSNSICHIMDKSFIKFPNLVSLSLQDNNITDITTLTFAGLTNLEFLNLVRNRVSVFIKGSFDHLKNLKVLDLSRNNFNASFMPGVFSNLVNVIKLYITGDLVNAKSYPSEEIGRLTNLTLLSVDGISKDVILGPEMKNLTKLVKLHVGFSRKQECRLEQVTESFLENVPYLQTVRFSKCPLQNVNVEVYRKVRGLRSLEFFSTYPYDVFKALDGLSGMQNSSLRSLRLIKLIKDGCPFICLYKRHARYLKGIDLELLDLSENRIAFMEKAFIEALPQTLKALVLRGNELSEPSLMTEKLYFLQNLVFIDLGTYPDRVLSNEVSKSRDRDQVSKLEPNNGISPLKVRKESEHEEMVTGVAETKDEKQNIYVTHKPKKLLIPRSLASAENSTDLLMYEADISEVPPECREQKDNSSATTLYSHITSENKTSLRRLLASRFLEIDLVKLFRNIARTYTNLTYIDLSYCALSPLSQHSKVPSSIQTAVFNGNFFRHMHEGTFDGNNSLCSLFLSNNLLGDIIASTNSHIFKTLEKLEHLDISTNMIYTLPLSFFKGLHSLKYLIMYDNKLDILNTDFTKTPQLEYLDLRKNSITWISKSSRDELDAIATNHPLYIELTSNPLSCTCEGLELLHWIWASNIHFVSKDLLSCVGDNNIAEDMGNIDDRVRTLQRQCAGKYLIIVLCVASLAVISFLVVFGVMYRYRWQLRYIRNIALSRLIGFKPRDTESSEFKFDAFIVYSKMSRQFVFGRCLEELEVKRGHKLCVDDRDFMPGTYDVSAIVSAIQNSRKTVLILSPDFYDEQFSEYSVKMALMEEIYQKRSVLYLCIYRPLPDDEMSKSYDLLMIMNRNNYLEFPPETETSDEVRNNFWDQLSEIIGHSIAKDLPESVETTN